MNCEKSWALNLRLTADSAVPIATGHTSTTNACAARRGTRPRWMRDGAMGARWARWVRDGRAMGAQWAARRPLAAAAQREAYGISFLTYI